MASIEASADSHLPLRSVAVVLYCATSFLSAGLLFCLEPMFSKMVLPELGGSAAVWSVAMMVFQGLLLGGYVYAHLLTKFVGTRRATLLHVVVMAVSALSLPIAIAHGFEKPPSAGVPLWTIMLFVASIGLPFFAISANAPLLQAWYSGLDRKSASNPYFLYRASNLGSFVVLLAYPFAIEPVFGLAQQSHLWSLGYGVLIAGVALCGLSVAQLSTPTASAAATRPHTRVRVVLSWIALGFVPSGLLVAVTAHIATDAASAPFLWIVPLALYLLSFVFAFAERQALPPKLVLALQPVTVGALAILFLWAGKVSWAIALPCHLLAFFVAAMVCHTRLYRLRPPASDLTRFYAWMSLGGVLGGTFSALLAPALFKTVLEYPLLILAALLARPGLFASVRVEWRKETVFVAAVVGALAAALFLVGKDARVAYFAMAVMTLAAFTAFQANRPVRLLGFAAVSLLVATLYDPTQSIVARARSFYGAYKVVDVDDGRLRVLFHGATAHGAEQIRDERGNAVSSRPEPLAYYYKGGAHSEAIDAVRRRDGGMLRNVALVGLGMGALTCFAQPNEHWTLYELDPLIVEIAKDRRLFRSMAACARHATVVVGDGRLTLADARPGIDLLILDAFSSDAVPTHLLTKEAFALYAARLGPHGVIVVHISNKNMELSGVVAASAAANGMVTAIKTDRGSADQARTLRLPAEVAVVARSSADLEALRLDSTWRPAVPARRVWTDDYSNVLAAIIRKLRE